MKRIQPILMLFCLLTIWYAPVQAQKENSVKINVIVPRGSERFILKADKAWWKLFAGTSNTLPGLLKTLHGRQDLVDPASIDPEHDLSNASIIEVKKQSLNPQQSDCAFLQELRIIIESKINPKRKVTWQLSGKPHPCLQTVGLAQL